MVTRGAATALVAMGITGSMLTAVPASADDQGGAVLSEINATRAANGCGPVSPNPQLTASAARHARDMLDNGVQSHIGSDGSSLVQRVSDAGYTPYAQVGEIVYWTTDPRSAPGAAVTWWMNSPDHRAIITDCALTDAGFSVVRNGAEMTAAGDFGKK
ncbi:CAP domain-containing protein [Mycolicibacterium sp. 120270]|uniref:CAP domain-containing protein n=1 Tax=Mycolicibacterium sp. 120270 TaxID=3090600 RepID=UPI00299CE46F|nr:CAP domain-containing protein [Mycolicibacterium sp. 120270]MDX1887223.1 CAP domain-containing protein [Mycolicibacterium sp. 120270]